MKLLGSIDRSVVRFTAAVLIALLCLFSQVSLARAADDHGNAATKAAYCNR
jgi:hypothetical protein